MRARNRCMLSFYLSHAVMKAKTGEDTHRNVGASPKAALAQVFRGKGIQEFSGGVLCLPRGLKCLPGFRRPHPFELAACDQNLFAEMGAARIPEENLFDFGKHFVGWPGQTWSDLE